MIKEELKNVLLSEKWSEKETAVFTKKVGRPPTDAEQKTDWAVHMDNMSKVKADPQVMDDEGKAKADVATGGKGKGDDVKPGRKGRAIPKGANAYRRYVNGLRKNKKINKDEWKALRRALYKPEYNVDTPEGEAAFKKILRPYEYTGDEAQAERETPTGVSLVGTGVEEPKKMTNAAKWRKYRRETPRAPFMGKQLYKKLSWIAARLPGEKEDLRLKKAAAQAAKTAKGPEAEMMKARMSDTGAGPETAAAGGKDFEKQLARKNPLQNNSHSITDPGLKAKYTAKVRELAKDSELNARAKKTGNPAHWLKNRVFKHVNKMMADGTL